MDNEVSSHCLKTFLLYSCKATFSIQERYLMSSAHSF